MAVIYGNGKKTTSALTKVIVAAIIGALVGGAALTLASWRIAPLLGWDAAALTFTLWTWLTVWPMSGEQTEHFSLREDPSRAGSDIVLLVASVFSLSAVGLVLFASGNSEGADKFLQAFLSVISVVLSWVTVHTIFMLRYGELYYEKPRGGVDFGDTKQPSYKDFAYLAFTLGMTFQVSDTMLSNSRFRHAALRHALVSYVFGTVILAATINLVAGMTS